MQPANIDGRYNIYNLTKRQTEVLIQKAVKLPSLIYEEETGVRKICYFCGPGETRAIITLYPSGKTRVDKEAAQSAKVIHDITDLLENIEDLTKFDRRPSAEEKVRQKKEEEKKEGETQALSGEDLKNYFINNAGRPLTQPR